MNPDWFSGRLRELREAAGLTQPQLAEKVRMSTRQISRLETGAHVATWETVVALCKVLGVGVEAFTVPPQTDTAPRPRGRPRKDGGEQAAKGKGRKRREK